MSQVRCSCSLFFHSRSFPPQWPLVVSAHFLTRAIFKLFFQQKNDSFPFFLSRQLSVALLLVKLRRLVAYFLFFSVLLFLNISIFVDMTINSSLILQTTRIQKQFPLSVFVFIDSLVVYASQDDFPPKELRVALELPYLSIELFYIGISVVLTDGGREDGRKFT